MAVSPPKRHALLRANICSMQKTLVAQAQLACLCTRLLVRCCACACVCARGLWPPRGGPPIGPLCCQTGVSPFASFFLENFMIVVCGMRGGDDARVRALVARVVAALAGASLEEGVSALWFTLRIYVREQVIWSGRRRR